MFAVGSVAVLLGLVGCATGSERQRQVREAGETVMPFDLDETTHTFTKHETGGTQTVVARDVRDGVQVGLVRTHLREIRDKFAGGDFSDPIRIHGADMPGVAELAAGAARLKITYREIAGGGEIVYQSEDGALVGAIHAWFDAQNADHGEDANAPGHVMTEEMWRNHHPGTPYPGTTTGE
jgi:hypothetical protein